MRCAIEVKLADLKDHLRPIARRGCGPKYEAAL